MSLVNHFQRSLSLSLLPDAAAVPKDYRMSATQQESCVEHIGQIWEEENMPSHLANLLDLES